MIDKRIWKEEKESNTKVNNYPELQDLSQQVMEIDHLLQMVSY